MARQWAISKLVSKRNKLVTNKGVQGLSVLFVCSCPPINYKFYYLWQALSIKKLILPLITFFWLGSGAAVLTVKDKMSSLVFKSRSGWKICVPDFVLRYTNVMVPRKVYTKRTLIDFSVNVHYVLEIKKKF